MSDTAEIHRNGNGSFRKFVDAIVLALSIAGISAGVALYTKQEVTAQSLVDFKLVQTRGQDDLRTEMKAMREELRNELRELRQAVDRRR